MHRLSTANDARYVHLLQPNQRVPDSKPMSQAERGIALADNPYADHARAGYAALIARGAELAPAGVEYHDLTRLFADVEEPLYSDSCCHLSVAGYARVARALCEAL